MDLIEELDLSQFSEELNRLTHCTLCPRKCGADRFSSKLGYCNSDASFFISSICIHQGEEPVISGKHGICNVFFGHCNLQCIFCQNFQISDKRSVSNPYKNDLTRIMDAILQILDEDINAIGFVSPSHFIPQMTVIIHILNALGRKPVVVYNSNGYDNVEELKKLEGLVDVYLPDFKYMDESLARRYSDAPDYPDIALNAIREMYRQKGSTLIVNDQGSAESGLIIRHLVLPGHVENSLKVLDTIASEISPSVHISLMSQYHPVYRVYDDPLLSRRLHYNEYKMVVDRMESLGLDRGWIQEMDSAGNYRPDFDQNRPFG